jgi:hypothetical protein
MATDDSTTDDTMSNLWRQYGDALGYCELDSAETIAHKFLADVVEWGDQNTSPDLRLTTAARHCEDKGDWVGAESAFLQIFSLPNLEEYKVAKAHSDLAALYSILNRRSEALHHAQLATAAVRSDVPAILAMQLRYEAKCLIRSDLIDLAEAALNEALLVIGDEKMFNQMRASIMILQADCRLHFGHYAESECLLKAAFDLLEPLSHMEIAAGVHADVANWWSTRARLCSKQDDCDGAVTAWEKAVQTAKHVASLPHAESIYARIKVAEMLNGLANSLEACDCAEDAAVARAERRTILEAIGIPLENVE